MVSSATETAVSASISTPVAELVVTVAVQAMPASSIARSIQAWYWLSGGCVLIG